MKKRCTKCGEEKAIEMFYKNKRNVGGFSHWCKKCQNEKSQEYYHKNPEKRRRQVDVSRKKRRAEDIRICFSQKFSRSEERKGKRSGERRIHATVDELIQLYNNDPGCKYCRVRLHFSEVSFDHITPFSRGGSSTIENLSVSCVPCNRLKRDMTEEEFLSFLSEYRDRLNALVGISTYPTA